MKYDDAHISAYRENSRFEAKLAEDALPESIWETYSAFANTRGGIIVLGLKENRDRSLEARGVRDPEPILERFYEILRDPERVSADILTEESVRTLCTDDGRRVIEIEVPRAKRADMPVYVGGSPYSGAYRRIGDADIRLTKREIRRISLGAKIKRAVSGRGNACII